MAASRGEIAYAVYRATSRAATPLARLLLHWRRRRGLEHPTRWPERLGRASSPRPPGTLLWFHAVSLGEGLAAIPLIKHCIIQRPDCNVLLTTSTISAFEVIKDRLPEGAIYQFAPFDIPDAVEEFLGHWCPNAVFLMESELWPNLIVSAYRKGVKVAIINARMSLMSFRRWSGSMGKPLIALLLSMMALISSLSTVEAIRFQLLNAPPFIVNFAGNLKYAVGDYHLSDIEKKNIDESLLQLNNRRIWMAASLHKGEEEVFISAHNELVKMYPDLATVLVTRHPQFGQEIASELNRRGLSTALRSRREICCPSTDFYIVDTLGELRMMYRIAPIAVIGGSFLPSLAGHNVAEAAAAGCAVLTGPYVGHFAHMLMEMQLSDPLSVLQVPGKMELVDALRLLLGDSEALEARRQAARRAFSSLSDGVVRRVWDLIESRVLEKAL